MRAYYTYHSWTEPPGPGIGELVLGIHLAELYHDAAAAPGSARISLTAELTDPARRALVARRSFTFSAPATSYDAPGAVRAFNQALGALLDEVSAWVDGAAPR